MTWKCINCGQHNRVTNSSCSFCGALRKQVEDEPYLWRMEDKKECNCPSCQETRYPS
jgi:hypothetical protein